MSMLKGFGLLTDLIKRLEEENKVNVYLCQEKLPKVKSSIRLGKDKHSNSITVFFYNSGSKESDRKSPRKREPRLGVSVGNI